MGKRKIYTANEAKPQFANIKAYSVDEILAAGGTTAFSEKIGKSGKGLLAALKKIPKEDLLTEEEFQEAMKTLNESK